MNITAISSSNALRFATGATSAQRVPSTGRPTLDYSVARIAEIEETLSNARAFRRTVRMQLLQPLSSSGAPLISLELLYRDACDQVAAWEQALHDALVATL